MTLLYLDCYAGISGDMTLGALLDLGADLAEVRKVLAALKIDGLSLEVKRVSKKGVGASALEINFPPDPQPHRSFRDIRALLAAASLPEGVRERSLQVFGLLARAEGKIHGRDPEEVHFHEVGSLDSLVDIVGSTAALETLKPQRVLASPLPYSRGKVSCSHGILPLPAPATLEICRENRIPLIPPPLDVEGELVTPTGAALAAVLAQGFGPPPPLVVRAVGYGAGTKDFPFPNLLRAVLAEPAGEEEGIFTDENLLLETNIDDMSPEYYEHLSASLFRAGALDVFLTPVQMKKNRPGVKLSVLAPPGKAAALREVIFRESTSIGLRETRVTKRELPRAIEKVKTPWGEVRVKVCTLKGRVVNQAPEYEDCLRVAREHQVPLKEVYDKVRHILGENIS